MEIPQKIKNKSTIQPSNSTSTELSKGYKISISKRYLQPHVNCSSVYNKQDMETTWESITRWTDKESDICVYVCVCVCYSAIKEEGNPATCDNMNGPWRHYTKWNKSSKEKCCIISLVCQIFKKAKLIETVGWYLPGPGRWGMGDTGRCWSQGTNLQL